MGDVKGKIYSSRITAMTLKMDIEKGEFLQECSDFRSYEWSRGRRMAVRCIVQDKNGDIPLPLENKEHLRGKTKDSPETFFLKIQLFSCIV